MERPVLDESKAEDFLGKTILIGITYIDQLGELIEQKQLFGTIETYSNKIGIRVSLEDSDKCHCLPPDPRALKKAPPGTYRLKSTGQVIENPDYLTTWTYRAPAPDEAT